MKKTTKSIAALGVLLATQGAFAETHGPQKDQFFASLLGSYYDLGDDYETTSYDIGMGAGFGYSFAENWAAEVQWFTHDPDVELNNGRSGELDVEMWSLSVLRSIDIGRDWSPYVSLGVGEGRLDYGPLSNAGVFTEEELSLGLGMFSNVTDQFAIRADIRGVYHNRIDAVRPQATIGVTMMLGGSPAPVAAAAPAPAPAPAAGPKDTDGDGVIDPNDRCPDTPKGDRVGPHGCSCDVSVQLNFVFDSAELTEADKEKLVGTAARLKELNWISGIAEGHTDSTGTDAYNQGLSERRAKSVVDFLASQGVDASRIRATGKGESQPVADNGTEEGRAQNRRVILKRTDCDTN